MPQAEKNKIFADAAKQADESGLNLDTFSNVAALLVSGYLVKDAVNLISYIAPHMKRDLEANSPVWQFMKNEFDRAKTAEQELKTAVYKMKGGITSPVPVSEYALGELYANSPREIQVAMRRKAGTNQPLMNAIN